MPEPPKFNLANILKEERKEKLSPVDKDFYEKAKRFIRELGIELERIDPESTKYQMLEDEVLTAKKNLRSILEIRMTKINYEASVRKSLKSHDGGEPENMTPDERDLYIGLYDLMKNFRNKRLDAKVTHAPAPEPARKPMVNIGDYMVVRALHDIPMFAGMDGRNYTLAKEDIATIPVINANALISKTAVVRINSGAVEKTR